MGVNVSSHNAVIVNVKFIGKYFTGCFVCILGIADGKINGKMYEWITARFLAIFAQSIDVI